MLLESYVSLGAKADESSELATFSFGALAPSVGLKRKADFHVIEG